MSSRAQTVSRSMVIVALLCAGVLAGAAPALASPRTEVVQGRYIRLVSTADWGMAGALQPGEQVQWDVEVSARAPEPGTMRIGLSADGSVGLVVDARLCALAWSGGVCPGGADVLRTGWVVPRDGTRAELASIRADAVAHLRLDVRLQGGGAGSTGIRVLVDGAQDSVSAGPGDLAATGGMAPLGGVLGGFGIGLLGAVLMLAAAVVPSWRRRVQQRALARASSADADADAATKARRS